MIRCSLIAALALAVSACSSSDKTDSPAPTPQQAPTAAKTNAKANPAGNGQGPTKLAPTPVAVAKAPPSKALPASAANSADKLATMASGEWVSVGKAGDWTSTRLAAVLGDHLFTIQRGDGRLFKTHVATGKYAVIGKGDYSSSRWLLTSATEVLTIESDGTLYRIDANTGTWKTVGKRGDWKSTRLAVAHGGHLYTVSRGDGRLFKTDIATGKYTVLGKGDYSDSKRLLATADSLLTIERDGTLYRISQADGTWKTVGKKGSWKSTRLAAVHGDYLFTVERADGRLFKTAIATGKYTAFSKGDYSNSKRLLATTKALVTIESDGTLFRVKP